MTNHLRVHDQGRYLIDADGKPFFWLGDTAWELLHRLDREEADRYLTNRAAKGFTVIQTVVLAERKGLDDPNPYGALPLIDRDPAQPNAAYFDHVDYIINRAADLGLTVGLLPTWGFYWKKELDLIFTPENAYTFGHFLGERYKDAPVVWILGGDANIDSAEERAIIDNMAHGLHAGDGGNHLRTFHPRGPGLSSTQLADADWIDFHMSQSSHGAHDHDNGLYIDHDYALTPPKPTLDGEPRYESIPVGFYFRNSDPYVRFDDYDVRQAAYWALLAGACGHTYGNNNVWQMWAPGRDPVIRADIPWWEALDHPGAFQMRWVRRLFTARPFSQLVPMQSLVLDGPSSGGAKIRAALADDGSFALIYSPRGENFTLDCTRFPFTQLKELWYDPRYGVAHHMHTTTSKGIQTYAPPTKGRGQDWILIIEDESRQYPLPSSVG